MRREFCVTVGPVYILGGSYAGGHGVLVGVVGPTHHVGLVLAAGRNPPHADLANLADDGTDL